MSEISMVDQLNVGVELLLAGRGPEITGTDPEVAELLALAAELGTLPRLDLKEQLKADLLGQVEHAGMKHNDAEIRVAGERRSGQGIPSPMLAALVDSRDHLYPVRRSSFMASLAAHAAMLALLVTAGIWAAPSFREKPRVHSLLVTDLNAFVAPPTNDEGRGGGGGGDSSILPSPRGTPPRFTRDQFAPPAMVVHREQPKLAAEPTVIGPPALSFPQTSQLGDPFSHSSGTLSNGPGSGSGIGNGQLGGVGPGKGAGVGDGYSGGIGGGPFVPGGGVSAPHLIYDPEPEYSEEARKQKYQGVVVLQVVVGEDGRPRDVRIVRSVGLGLDEKAQQAVRTWRFEPGTLNGRPVAVLVNVQVNFRLY